MNEIFLTEYSHGAGCGCKIAPKILEEILNGSQIGSSNNLLVGNAENDDAAVFQLDNDQLLVTTTDFFSPIVDDAKIFGKIAAANALSDIYAMGAQPIFSLAILGWPVSKLPIELAKEVMNGAKEICSSRSIPIAGGHSIDIPEPVFGLAVNGLCSTKNLKRNNTANKGDFIFMNKKIGSGILTTALKRKIISINELGECIQQMCVVNSIGELLGKNSAVTAMTDITGFGLCGHLLEMVKGKNLTIQLNYQHVPFLDGVKELAAKFIYPDNTMRNWNAYQPYVEGITGDSLLSLCDPQTNGGLLVAVKKELADEFQKEYQDFVLIAEVIEKTDEFYLKIKH